MYISICSCIVTVLKGVSPVLERSLFTIIIHCYRECDAVTIFSTYIYIYIHMHILYYTHNLHVTLTNFSIRIYPKVQIAVYLLDLLASNYTIEAH